MAVHQLLEYCRQSLLATGYYDTLEYDYSEYFVSCALSEWYDCVREPFG
jgi:hypothetical protein